VDARRARDAGLRFRHEMLRANFILPSLAFASEV